MVRPYKFHPYGWLMRRNIYKPEGAIGHWDRQFFIGAPLEILTLVSPHSGKFVEYLGVVYDLF
jgi:hypothetical protein